MCHQIPNITLHAFRCSESILRYFVICPKRTSMHHIPHTDLHFSSRTRRANPAGTGFLHVFWCTTLCFCKNFTHRALLERNYWNALMVFVQNWSETVGFNQKRAYFLKDGTFLQNMCDGIPNITYHAFCCPKFKLWVGKRRYTLWPVHATNDATSQNQTGVVCDSWQHSVEVTCRTTQSETNLRLTQADNECVRFIVHRINKLLVTKKRAP